MQISSLKVNNFRNYSALLAEFSGGVNIFYGRNGSGKTNLLEAIFNLCLGRSQRGASDSLLLRSGCDVYRLEGTLEHDEHSQLVSVAFQSGGRKKVTIDGLVERITALYERFCAVSAGTEDSAILSGSPSVRRGFMDIYLSQLSRRYLADLTDYQKVLAQKNAALKQGMDCSAFEPLQAAIGSRIMVKRREFVSSLRDVAGRYYRGISGGEQMEIGYEPSVRLTDGDETLQEIEQAFCDKLARQAERERIMQTAMVGPHRDEIRFEINGFPARTHGSQGQWRTSAIALKLAIYELLKAKRGMAPILLLDEIFAELDRGRSASLIEAFGEFAQLFLTTAVEPPEGLRTGGRAYRIENGMIEEVH